VLSGADLGGDLAEIPFPLAHEGILIRRDRLRHLETGGNGRIYSRSFGNIHCSLSDHCRPLAQRVQERSELGPHQPMSGSTAGKSRAKLPGGRLRLKRASLGCCRADTFLVSRTRQLATLTVRHAMPAIFQDRAFAAAGGLMSYGGSVTDL
jgi:hypothetical protein